MQVSKHPAASAYTKIASKTANLMGPIQSPSSPGLSLPQQAALMAAPLVVGKAIDLGIAAVQKVRDAASKGRAFKDMLDVNPHLQGGDAVTVQRYFNTLYRMNPDFAQDPVVAGSFVANQLSMHTPNRPHSGMFDAAQKLVQSNRGGYGGPSAGDQITKYLLDVQGAASKDVVKGLQGQLQESQGQLKDTQGKLHQSRGARRSQVLSWVRQHKQRGGGQPQP
jgi:hypothetical protein